MTGWGTMRHSISHHGAAQGLQGQTCLVFLLPERPPAWACAGKCACVGGSVCVCVRARVGVCTSARVHLDQRWYRSGRSWSPGVEEGHRVLPPQLCPCSAPALSALRPPQPLEPRRTLPAPSTAGSGLAAPACPWAPPRPLRVLRNYSHPRHPSHSGILLVWCFCLVQIYFIYSLETFRPNRAKNWGGADVSIPSLPQIRGKCKSVLLPQEAAGTPAG